MPPRGKIESLPEDVRRWLERALTENGFSGYRELEALLQEKGYFIGRNTINRYGQKLERRMAAIKASTEAARMIADAAPDDADNRSAAVISLVQTELFDTILEMQEVGEEKMDSATRVGILSKAAKNIATLTRASVGLKKYQTEVRTRAELAASNVEKIARKGGLSAEAAAQIRSEILGIAS